MVAETKFNKLKIAGLTTVLLGGLAIAGIVYNNSKNSKNEPNIPTSEQTIKQMEKYIKTADEVLADLDKTIESKDTDPETRFEARQAKKQVIQERASMQQKLDRAKKGEHMTITPRDLGFVR